MTHTCILLMADMPACTRPALVQIEDLTGERAWGCPSHATQALRCIDGARTVADLRDKKERDRR